MCCFNKPVNHVGATRIMVFVGKDGRQVTLYENVVRGTGKTSPHPSGPGKAPVAPEKASKAKYGNAMVLPAPLKPGSKITLLDLSKDSFSFKRILDWWPQNTDRKRAGRGAAKESSNSVLAPKLEVHEVGSYFISLAENLNDLDRIDKNVFEVSPGLKSLFSKHYDEGFGFVICSFNPDAELHAHPIGYVHDTMDNGRLFVPTRHFHGDYAKEEEFFDHDVLSLNTKNDGEAGQSVEEAESAGSVNFTPVKSKPEEVRLILRSEVLDSLFPQINSLRRRTIKGRRANTDFVFAAA